MKAERISPAAVLIVMLVVAGGMAAEESAHGKARKKPIATSSDQMSPPNVSSGRHYHRVSVPSDPLNILWRYFDLGDHQVELLTELRQQRERDRHQAMLEVRSQLDAKYTNILRDRLSGELRELFINVQDAITAYREKLRDMDRELREEWKETFKEEVPSSIYRCPPRYEVLRLLPGLSKSMKKQLETEYHRQIDLETRRRAEKKLAEQGVKQPNLPRNRKDKKARREYNEYRKKLWAVQKQLRHDVETEKLDKIKSELSEEQRRSFELAWAIVERYSSKQQEAIDDLARSLSKSVPPERLVRLGVASHSRR